jgi:hypothetical protein
MSKQGTHVALNISRTDIDRMVAQFNRNGGRNGWTATDVAGAYYGWAVHNGQREDTVIVRFFVTNKRGANDSMAAELSTNDFSVIRWLPSNRSNMQIAFDNETVNLVDDRETKLTVAVMAQNELALWLQQFNLASNADVVDLFTNNAPHEVDMKFRRELVDHLNANADADAIVRRAYSL